MTTQILVILVVVGFSVVQAIVKYLAGQAEKRRQQQAQQRAELDLLRTGRTAESSEHASPVDSDARRREELAELRRRAQSRRESDGGVQMPNQAERQQAATPLEILLGLPPGTTSGGTVAPRTSRSSGTPLPSTLSAPSKSRKQKERGDPEAKRRRQEQQRLRAEQTAAEARRKQEILDLQARTARAAAQTSAVDQRLLRDAKPVTAGNAPLGTIGVVPRSPAEWRRAIAMNEVLSKPVSLR